MQEKKIKLVVDGHITTCCQLRVKKKGEERDSFFCGFDFDKHHVYTTWRHFWEYSILLLVDRIVQESVHGNIDVYEFRNIDDIEYLHVVDDSEAVVGVDTEESLEEYRIRCREMYEKLSFDHEEFKKIFDELSWNEEEKEWTGEITVNI